MSEWELTRKVPEGELDLGKNGNHSCNNSFVISPPRKSSRNVHPHPYLEVILCFQTFVHFKKKRIKWKASLL
jgi:hypothetical protein